MVLCQITLQLVGHPSGHSHCAEISEFLRLLLGPFSFAPSFDYLPVFPFIYGRSFTCAYSGRRFFQTDSSLDFMV
uniref:Uncharacterized protein n=1 Tax=Physcomitrium patens TaxID=3218 RepID=A0A2K1IUN2_PHYPA|nr:hypothetical protein PHYPA_024928 [Physcomitrium patens]